MRPDNDDPRSANGRMRARGADGIRFGAIRSGRRYPNKPIHFVLGLCAAAGTDLLARIVGRACRHPRSAVVIENRTARRTARGGICAGPAGGRPHLAIGAIGQLAVATAIYPGKLSFHPTRTLMPITHAGVLSTGADRAGRWSKSRRRRT